MTFSKVIYLQPSEELMPYPATQVIETYHRLIREKTKKALKVILIIAVIFLILSIIAMVIDASREGLFLILALVFAGIFLILSIIGLIVRRTFVSEKPLYTYLYPKLIEELQYNEDHIIKYEAYPKISEIIAESKLFYRHAASTTRAGFYFNAKDALPVKVYDTYCYTSTSESTDVHFNGYYVVIDGVQARPIQIRTKGSPARSKIHTNRIGNDKRLKVFCETPDASSQERMMTIFRIFNDRYKPRNLFLSVIGPMIYIAVDLKKPMRTYRTLNEHSYKEIRNQLLLMVDTVNEALVQGTE